MLGWTYNCVYCWLQHAVFFATNKWLNMCIESGFVHHQLVTTTRKRKRKEKKKKREKKHYIINIVTKMISFFFFLNPKPSHIFNSISSRTDVC